MGGLSTIRLAVSLYLGAGGEINNLITPGPRQFGISVNEVQHAAVKPCHFLVTMTFFLIKFHVGDGRASLFVAV